MLVCTQQRSLPFYYAPTCTQFSDCRLLLHFVSKFEYDAREAVVETASFFVPLAQIMHITVSFEAVLCISRAILSGYARMSLSSLKPSKDAFALILSPFYGANRFKNGSKTVQPSDLSAVNSSKTVQPAERLSRFGNTSSSGSYPSSMYAANRGDTPPFLLRQSI